MSLRMLRGTFKIGSIMRNYATDRPANDNLSPLLQSVLAALSGGEGSAPGRNEVKT